MDWLLTCASLFGVAYPSKYLLHEKITPPYEAYRYLELSVPAINCRVEK